MNTNKIDINGFIEIAKNLKANVIISRDFLKIGTKMSENEYSTLLYFARRCEENSIVYRILKSPLNRDFDRAEADNLILEENISLV